MKLKLRLRDTCEEIQWKYWHKTVIFFLTTANKFAATLLSSVSVKKAAITLSNRLSNKTFLPEDYVLICNNNIAQNDDCAITLAIPIHDNTLRLLKYGVHKWWTSRKIWLQIWWRSLWGHCGRSTVSYDWKLIGCSLWT